VSLLIFANARLPLLEFAESKDEPFQGLLPLALFKNQSLTSSLARNREAGDDFDESAHHVVRSVLPRSKWGITPICWKSSR
jgi:hypothetical protein